MFEEGFVVLVEPESVVALDESEPLEPAGSFDPPLSEPLDDESLDDELDSPLVEPLDSLPAFLPVPPRLSVL